MKPGVGLRTNAFLSELFSTGGLFKKPRSKDNNYGAFFRLYLEASRSSYLDLAFQKDLNATGTFYFLEGVEPFSDEVFKMFATESVDLTRKYSIAVTQQLSASLKGELSWNHAILSPRTLYPFLTDSTNLGDLQGNEAGLRLKWHTKRNCYNHLDQCLLDRAIRQCLTNISGWKPRLKYLYLCQLYGLQM